MILAFLFERQTQMTRELSYSGSISVGIWVEKDSVTWTCCPSVGSQKSELKAEVFKRITAFPSTT